MSVKPINHYSLENPASVYDEEAMTSLELAGRTAHKVNETVKAFNDLEAQTNTHLEAQDQEIAERTKAQDNAIEKMNDVTMPAKVTAEVQEQIDNGTFDKAIDKYAGELTNRLTNLLTNYEPGGTTADAELADMRLDADGRIHETAGDATRVSGQRITNLYDLLTSGNDGDALKFTGVYPAVELQPATYLDHAGRIQPLASEVTNFKTARVNVDELSAYRMYSSANYGNAVFAVFDSNDNLIYAPKSAPGSTRTVFDGVYHTPKNASYINISIAGEATTPLHLIYKIAGIEMSDTLKTSSLMTEALQDLLINGDNVVYNITGEKLNATVDADCVLYYDGTLLPLETLIPGYAVETANVTEGKVYYIKGCANYGNATHAFYNANGDLLTINRPTGEPHEAYKYFTKLVIAPPTATSVRVAYNTDALDGGVFENPSLEQVAKEWSGKKWVCMGDSLTERNLRTDISYHDYVAEKTGIQVVNMGRSGTGYMRTQGSGNAFYQRIANVPKDADVVTIFGSGNDLNHIDALGSPDDTGTDTLCGCINTTIDALFQTLPTVQLGIVAPTPWVGNEPSNNGSMVRYCEALEAICKRRGIPYLDLFHSSGLRPNDATFRTLAYSKDEGNGVHPDETGHKMISSKFYAFLQSLIGTY